MTSAVFDASVVLRWLIDDPLSGRALDLRRRYNPVAPKLLLLAVANALRTQVRFGRWPAEKAGRQVGLLSGQVDLLDQDVQAPMAFKLAIDFDHAVYDCVYVAMAMTTALPLVTADGKLARKFAQAPGLELILLFDGGH